MERNSCWSFSLVSTRKRNDNVMRLLIVDDDAHQLERYRESIADFNEKNQSNIQPEYRDNLEDGLQSLAQEYDGAIVDLKLSGATESATGNVIIREIKKSKRFPICVLTGYPNDLDPDLQEELRTPNLFFRLDKRDRPLVEILKHLTMIHESGVLDIVGPHGLIENALNTIFWTHLAKTLAFWSNQPEANANRKNRLMRFILGHLLQKLESNEDGDLDDCYPDEMYIIPHLRDDWQTGDIVFRKQDGVGFLIVTPACDLAQGKAKSVQIVEIDSFEKGVIASNVNICRKQLPDGAADGAKAEHLNKRNAALIELGRLVGNSYSNRYHFLPPCENFPGGLLNFQKIQSIVIADFSKAFTKHGTITTGFLKDIISRFSAYYARQGQPNFESEKIIERMIKPSQN